MIFEGDAGYKMHDSGYRMQDYDGCIHQTGII